MKLSYLSIGLGLCKLNLEVKQFSRRLLNLFSICILLADQLSVGILEGNKGKYSVREFLIQLTDYFLECSCSPSSPPTCRLVVRSRYLLMVCW